MFRARCHTLSARCFGTVAGTGPAQYRIGTLGTPWGPRERAEWIASRKVIRSYQDDVLSQIEGLKGQFDVAQYGALSHNPERYPLFSVRSRDWSLHKPSVLVTGGVHGYHKSGVQGALRFLLTAAEKYKRFNILVAPCVSPWGYETGERWNPQAADPNRSFNPQGEVVEGRSFLKPEPATDESAMLIHHLAFFNDRQWLCHIDLHETTDADESEFMPAEAARDGKTHVPHSIPDGFYLVTCGTKPQTQWHKAMIDAVQKVTHIAPPDAEGKIIGYDLLQEGVIGIPSPRLLGLCAGVTNAPYATTTQVYADSPKVSDEDCNLAQVTTVTSALGFLEKKRLSSLGMPEF